MTKRSSKNVAFTQVSMSRRMDLAIRGWLEENCIGRYAYYGGGIYLFENELDAAKFKLFHC